MGHKHSIQMYWWCTCTTFHSTANPCFTRSFLMDFGYSRRTCLRYLPLARTAFLAPALPIVRSGWHGCCCGSRCSPWDQLFIHAAAIDRMCSVTARLHPLSPAAASSCWPSLCPLRLFLILLTSLFPFALFSPSTSVSSLVSDFGGVTPPQMLLNPAAYFALNSVVTIFCHSRNSVGCICSCFCNWIWANCRSHK